jgi:hypothetical protein
MTESEKRKGRCSRAGLVDATPTAMRTGAIRGRCLPGGGGPAQGAVLHRTGISADRLPAPILR